MMKRPYFFAWMFICTITYPAFAHVPNISTSRLSLREEVIEVLAEWDLFALTDVPPIEIATATADKLGGAHRSLQWKIENETRLRADNKEIPLKIRGFPDVNEFQALAAQVSTAGETHGARVRIRLEATEKVVAPKTISLASPKDLGEVIVSFVQPTSRYVTHGEAAQFDVLARISNEAIPTNSITPIWSAFTVAVVMGILFWRYRK